MLECISNYILSLFPEGFDPGQMFRSVIFLIGIVSLAGIVIKFFFKTATAYLHALSSAMAILFFYLVNILLYPVLPGIVGKVLETLPLIDVSAEGVTLHTIQFGLQYLPELSREFLPVLVFSGILIILDDLIPDAKNTFGWILLQFAIVCATCLFYWAFEKLIGVLPVNIVSQYAPVILFCVLFIFVAMGLMKIIFTFILVSVSPLLGAVGAWFSTSPFGRTLGKSVLCAVLVCAAFFYLTVIGMGTILFADVSALVYVLYMLILLGLWVFTGHFL